MDVEQHRAGGVGDVGGVDPSASESMEEPRVDGACIQFASFPTLLPLRRVVQNPPDLGAGEVGVDDQSGPLFDQGVQPI